MTKSTAASQSRNTEAAASTTMTSYLADHIGPLFAAEAT